MPLAFKGVTTEFNLGDLIFKGVTLEFVNKDLIFKVVTLEFELPSGFGQIIRKR